MEFCTIVVNRVLTLQYSILLAEKLDKKSTKFKQSENQYYYYYYCYYCYYYYYYYHLFHYYIIINQYLKKKVDEVSSISEKTLRTVDLHCLLERCV